MKHKIRLMQSKDLLSVVALWKNTPGIGLDKDCDSIRGLKRYLRRNPRLSYIATVDSLIVGAVLSGHDGRRGYLHHLAVDPDYRKQGIANTLIQSCFKQLSRQHIPKCNIFLFKSNTSGRSFWIHNGWNLRPDLLLLQKMTNVCHCCHI
ncbi:MAG: GNAT family N-acetyltransferase [Fibrobacterota bacterium]